MAIQITAELEPQRLSAKLTVTGTAQPNVITNPGFETNTAGWTTSATASIARDTVEHYAGVASLQVTANSGSFQGAVQSPYSAAAAGQTWRLTAWVKAPAGMAMSGAVYCYDAGSVLVGTPSTPLTGNGAWQLLNGTVVLPANTTQVSAQFRTSVLATPFYVDEVSLKNDASPNLPAGADTYTIERTSPSGNTAGVRGAVDQPVGGAASIVARDYEFPFNTDIVYRAIITVDSTTEEDTVTFRHDVAECDTWLVDLARPTNSLPVLVESMVELAHEAAVGIHRVMNRRAPVMTTLPAWTPAAELVLLTDTLAERDTVRMILGSGYPYLLRTPPDLGVGNMYLGSTGFVEERFLTPGDAPERRFRDQCVQVERPDPGVYVPTPPNTYGHVLATFPTYADLLAGAGTYDEVAYAWPDDPALNPILPWLPDDV